MNNTSKRDYIAISILKGKLANRYFDHNHLNDENRKEYFKWLYELADEFLEAGEKA